MLTLLSSSSHQSRFPPLRGTRFGGGRRARAPSLSRETKMLGPVHLQSYKSFECPDSGVANDVACGMRVTTTANAPCATVLAEMKARVTASFDVWEDPHNNGTYTERGFFSSGSGNYATSRLTGDGAYTDKQLFFLSDAADGSSCVVEACSRSQVYSMYDQGEARISNATGSLRPPLPGMALLV